MSRNIQQINIDNPITTLTGTELMYVGVPTFADPDDNQAGLTADFKNYFKGVNVYTTAGGNPNGLVAGAVGDTLYATITNIFWICTTAGNAGAAVWSPTNSLVGTNNYSTASYTFALTDCNRLLSFSFAGAVTLTIPTNASIAIPVGTKIVVFLQNAATSVILSNAGVTINSPVTTFSTPLMSITFTKIATNTWDIDAVTGKAVTQQYFAEVALTDAATVTWNLNTQQVATLTMGASRLLQNPTNMIAGGVYILTVTQGGSGTNILTYDTAYKWPSGVAPVLSTAIGAIDILTFKSNGTAMYGVAQLDFS